jgi:hypothetical protein
MATVIPPREFQQSAYSSSFAEGKDQLRRLGGVTKDKVYQQIDSRKGEVCALLDKVAQSLESSIENDSGSSSHLIKSVAHYVRKASRSIEDGSAQQLIDRAQSDFHARPGIYLAGLLATGFFVGRLFRR